MDPIQHGGRLTQAQRRHPDAPLPWIDLSTGINPVAYPFAPPPPDAWRRLPEPEAVQALEAAAARAYGVHDPAMVAAAPGTQALIQVLPRLLPQPAIVIVSPTYAEHAAAWRDTGATITASATLTGRAAVLCNPNNPDGARYAPSVLMQRAAAMDLLVIDEAFADFEPGLSVAPFLPQPGMVALRSFGKAYGLAGLRLGFALAEPAVAAAIRRALGPWSVSGPAVTIGTEALNDAAWREREAAASHAAAARLDAALVAAGLTVLGGTALFRLARAAKAAGLAVRLARAGILVRSFADAPDRLRFGLPGDEAAWHRLTSALAATAQD